jgi:hypothetical protein
MSASNPSNDRSNADYPQRLIVDYDGYGHRGEKDILSAYRIEVGLGNCLITRFKWS